MIFMNNISKNITTRPFIMIWFISIVVNAIVTGTLVTIGMFSDDSTDIGGKIMVGFIYVIIAFIISILLSTPGLFLFIAISKFIISKFPDNFCWKILIVHLLCIISTFFILILSTGSQAYINNALHFILTCGSGGIVASSILILTLRKNKIFITAEQNV
jgi:hypothetical protein